MVNGTHTDKFRPSGEDPEALAKHAIRLLERHLHASHGITLRLGAELEYTLVPRHNKAVGRDLPAPVHFGAERDTLASQGFIPNASRKQRQDVRFALDPAPEVRDPAELRVPLTHSVDIDLSDRGCEKTTLLSGVTDPMLPDSPYVAYGYHELEHRQYEAVISHEAQQDRLPPDGSRALTFARAIEGLRHTLATSDHPSRRLARDPVHHALLKTIARDWKPSFAGSLPPVGTDRHTNGLHINLSALDSTGSPYMVGVGAPTPMLARSCGLMMAYGAHLLMHDATSVERESLRSHESFPNLSVHPRMSPHNRDTYLEITRPAANSNPYYATMLALLGIYRAVQTPGLEPHDSLRAAKTAADFQDRFFEKDNLVTSTLNALEPGLGERFKAAIAAHPPGTEKTTERLR